MPDHLRALLLPLLLGALAAPAAEPSRAVAEEARRHFNVSKDLYADGDLAGALNELERSYALVPNHKLLYNMGQIQAQQQNHAAALRSFQRFLAEKHASIPEARRAEVQREVEKLRTRVAELTVITIPEGAEVSVDDVPVGKSPLAGPLTVNLGRRKLTASLQNHFPAVRQVDLAGQETLTVRLELQPVVAPAEPVAAAAPAVERPAGAAVVQAAAPEPRRSLAPWVPWTATGVVAVGAGVAGVMTAVSSAEQRRLLTTFPITAAQQQAAATTTRSWALATDVLTGVAAAGALGSLLYTLLRPADGERPVATLGVGAGGLVVTGSLP